MSEPAKATFWPGATGRLTRMAPFPAGSVCSIITTASAPRGIGAPVATGVVAPVVTGNLGITPHGTISPVRERRKWTPAKVLRGSAPQTANPSKTDHSKGGAPADATTA